LPLITRAVSLARPGAHPGKEAWASFPCWCVNFYFKVIQVFDAYRSSPMDPTGWFNYVGEEKHAPHRKKGKQLTVSLDDVFVSFSKYF
jgi:hypothetical protein